MVLTLAQRGFSPGFSGFPLYLTCNSNLIMNGSGKTILWMCYCSIAIYLSIYFLLIVRVRISSISKTSLLKKYEMFLTVKRDCLPMTIHCFVVFLKLVINSS